jgi:hypothetical protein
MKRQKQTVSSHVKRGTKSGMTKGQAVKMALRKVKRRTK